MASKFLFFLLILFPTLLNAQKNVTNVTKSGMTGIDLPAGSKQDKRILSASAAKTLLEIKAGEIGRTITGNAEVLILPVSDEGDVVSSVKQRLKDSGYKINELKGEQGYLTIEKESGSILVYLYETKTATDFYSVALEQQEFLAEKTEAAQTATVAAEEIKSQPVTSNHNSAPAVIEPSNKVSAEKAVVPASSGYKFSRTTFDDGWIASIADDYVLLTRGTINVRLYYASPITEQMRPPVQEIHDYFWNTIVLPSFNIIQAWKWENGITYFSTYYIWAEAVEKSSGRNCYIGLNVGTGNGLANPVLAIASDKQTYDAQFPRPENITDMLGYNRFAVALSDLTGTWSSSGSSAMQYYNVYTGASAGMAIASSADYFTFSASGEYTSRHSGATGMVGNLQTYNQEYKGTATVTDWEIVLPNRWKGKTDTFEAWFEIIKGGRVLRLIDKNARGITYNLVRDH